MRSQSYEFESNSQLFPSIKYFLLLFEVTKLRIWKQLTTSLTDEATLSGLFEVTKLRIWKQLTTAKGIKKMICCCLRSQSYEFESNSQHIMQTTNNLEVVWGHKVTNLKATHNVQRWPKLPQALFEVTKLRIWKQLTTACFKYLYLLWLFEVTKLRIWKQLTTLYEVFLPPCGCLRSQSYEFESNSQQYLHWVLRLWCCLRSQSYEFESNSQHV